MPPGGPLGRQKHYLKRTILIRFRINSAAVIRQCRWNSYSLLQVCGDLNSKLFVIAKGDFEEPCVPSFHVFTNAQVSHRKHEQQAETDSRAHSTVRVPPPGK